MTDKQKAVMEQALGALESCSGVPHWPALQPTSTDLREALAAPTGSGFDEAAVERALVELAWQEDGAQWPDAYSQDEQKMEREKMRKALASPQLEYEDDLILYRQVARAIEQLVRQKVGIK